MNKDIGNKALKDDDLVHIIITIPTNSAELKLTAYSIKDGEVLTYSGYYDNEALRDARDKYLELDPDDCAFDVYGLTKEYQEYLNQYGDEQEITFEEYLKKYKKGE